jgi:hypothetical protein
LGLVLTKSKLLMNTSQVVAILAKSALILTRYIWELRFLRIRFKWEVLPCFLHVRAIL